MKSDEFRITLQSILTIKLITRQSYLINNVISICVRNVSNDNEKFESFQIHLFEFQCCKQYELACRFKLNETELIETMLLGRR